MTITCGDIGFRVGIKAIARLLSVGAPLLTTQRFAQTERLEKNVGNTVRWRRYHAFVVSKAPLAEGVPPTAQPLTKTDYTAIVKTYGALAELTDDVVDLHEDNVLDVLIKNCGRQMAETIEAVTIDKLKAGTNVFYANSVASRSLVTSPAVFSDFALISRSMDRNDATPISRIIAPTGKVSTMGVEDGFFAMGSTDLRADLRAIPTYKQYIEYGSPERRIPGEDGALDRFRFVLSRMFTPWAAAGVAGTTYLANGSAPSSSTACDVYPIICVAQDAYGVVRMQSTGPDIKMGRAPAHLYVKNPSSIDSGNALGQKGHVGWKVRYACAITNEDWIARLEVACTAKPA